MERLEHREINTDNGEPNAKLQDICELLVAAGYFRARVKGLSAFDKVVGGIVWCLEMCTVDVDVNFLFRENLNIGEKIEITEKIVHVLLSIKCPYSLEPHQIQGLDTVNILPVVQWLVKKAMETRESLDKHLRAVAKIHFCKNFPLTRFEEHIARQTAVLPSLFSVERKFKLVSGTEPLQFKNQVLATLMEYENFKQIPFHEIDSQQIKTTQISSEKKLETRAIAQHVSNLIHKKADVISQAIETYTMRQTEREGESDEISYLRKMHNSATEAIERVFRQVGNQQQVLNQLIEKKADLTAVQEELNNRRKYLTENETEEQRRILAQLDHLAQLNEQANAERKQFKNQCKIELEKLKIRNETLAKEEMAPVNEEQLKRKVDAVRQQLAGAQKTLGEKNVTLIRLRRQLDAVPSNAELNQYQRRFSELCAQVNEKQTELSSYYLLYNTLEDTKVFLNKELSLLTSIHDKFTDSMSSPTAKVEFLQQMETIVTAIRQNKSKIEKQFEALTEHQRELTRCLNRYAIEEVQYRETLKAIAQESQRYKQLSAQIGDEA